VDNAAPKPGDKVTVTVTVSNNGPATAAAPSVSYVPPSQLTNPEYSTDGGTTWAPWTGSASLPDMASGASKQLMIRSTVAADAKGAGSSIVTAASSTQDPNPANNMATVEIVMAGTTYKVTFFGYRCRTVSQMVPHGTAVPRPKDPQRNCYVFEGWYTAGCKGLLWDFSTPIMGDLCLRARWREKDSCSNPCSC
jgi:uncharacterized repeat protein (TIGR01451 family)/uncharacterized repeat protein (TIGR02543 family)